MPTSHGELDRPDDQIVSLLSHWLARHIGDSELRAGIARIGTADLQEEQAEAVGEFLTEFHVSSDTSRGELEKLVRETLEAVALGG